MSKIKTFEDACKAVGADPAAFVLAKDADGDETSVLAYRKLIVIAKALNKGWQPDWDNWNEYKYYPYFRYSGSGSGLSFDGYDYTYAITAVGSRLCFKTSKLAEYAGKTFLSIYTDYLTIKK